MSLAWEYTGFKVKQEECRVVGWVDRSHVHTVCEASVIDAESKRAFDEQNGFKAQLGVALQQQCTSL